MIKGIFKAAAGMVPKTVRLEMLANNLANINTTGFKKNNVFFEVLNEASTVEAREKGNLDASEAHHYIDFSEGLLNQTNNPLDMALQGNGFFAIETPQGTRYTRNGNFTLATNGTLVTTQGFPVLGTSGKIQIPDLQKHKSGSFSITITGEITVDKNAIGSLRIVKFDDVTRLKKEGASLFTATEGTEPRLVEEKDVVVKQGYLEESNVEGITEMIELIEMTRNFETAQRAIQLQDATLEKAMEVGRL